MTVLGRLSDWFRDQCDGEWEHGEGLLIETLDNPGWSVTIALGGTRLRSASFQEIKEHFDSETEWLRCWRDEASFHAVCGPRRLEDVIERFLAWADHEGRPA